MEKRYFVPTALVAALFLSAAVVAAAGGKVKGVGDSLSNVGTKLSLGKPEELKSLVPATLEDADAKIAPVRNRFIMWTQDGVHVMWGYYGNGFFTGTDNNGAKVWGIYGKNIFAGFYSYNGNSEFFYGKYNNGHWSAFGLFGEKFTRGKYVTFPAAIPVPMPEPVTTTLPA